MTFSTSVQTQAHRLLDSEHAEAASQDFLDSVIEQGAELIVRVLLPTEGRQHSTRLATLCQDWLQRQNIPHSLQIDKQGLWLRIDKSNTPVGLCASLQNDLSIALHHDVYVAYLRLDEYDKAVDAALLHVLQETALAARLLHSTEPLSCDQLHRRQALSAFRGAIHDDRIGFERQPIAELQSMCPSGYEFLARLYLQGSTMRRYILPSKHWIPHVIHSHDSIKLARRALIGAAHWLLHHPQRQAYASINLTAINFLDGSLIDQILSFAPEIRARLVLELTEWRDPRLYAQLPTIIEHLRAQGLRVAIDDFGAGYSSTDVLRDIAFDLIKLDIRLVQSRRSSDHALIDWTLRCAEQNGAHVVAEGIETPQLLQHAQSLGIRYAQGWYIDALLKPDERVAPSASSCC